MGWSCKHRWKKNCIFKGGAFAEGKITKSWNLSKDDVVNIKNGMFKTTINFKDKHKGLTTVGLWELIMRIGFLGIGILFIRNKRLEYRHSNEFDNLKNLMNYSINKIFFKIRR